MAQTEEEKKEWKELIERQEKANAEAKLWYEKQVERASQNALAGTTQAGVQPEVKKEETPAEYAKRISLGKL